MSAVDGARDAAHLLGPLVGTLALIAAAEVARQLRLVNVLLGLGILAAPVVLAGSTPLATLNSVRKPPS